MKDLLAARERFAPPPRVHVVVKKEDIDSSRLVGRVVIVLDILFATTTIVTALDRGAAAVIPAEDPAEARRIASAMPAGSFAIAGEDHLAAIPGFATPLPLGLTRSGGVEGKVLVYSTTNGTVALRHSQGADVVYAAALLNVDATLDHVELHHPGKQLVIVCAGSAGALNLEDFYAAGCFVDRLSRRLYVTRDFSDTALAALAVFRSSGAPEALAAARVGRIVRGVGAEEELQHAAQMDATRVVAMMRDDRVVRVE